MNKTLKYFTALLLTLIMIFELNIVSFANSYPTIKASEETTIQGKDINVFISLYNNPGLVNLLLSVEYNSDVLILTKVTDGKTLSALLEIIKEANSRRKPDPEPIFPVKLPAFPDD